MHQIHNYSLLAVCFVLAIATVFRLEVFGFGCIEMRYVVLKMVVESGCCWMMQDWKWRRSAEIEVVLENRRWRLTIMP